MLNNVRGGNLVTLRYVAIKGVVRGDLFMGSGVDAGEVAGRFKARGSLIVLVPNRAAARLAPSELRAEKWTRRFFADRGDHDKSAASGDANSSPDAVARQKKGLIIGRDPEITPDVRGAS